MKGLVARAELEPFVRLRKLAADPCRPTRDAVTMAAEAKLPHLTRGRTDYCAAGAHARDAGQGAGKLFGTFSRGSHSVRVVTIGAGDVPSARVDRIFPRFMRVVIECNGVNADFLKIRHHIPSGPVAAMTGKSSLFRLRKFHEPLFAIGKVR